ncbi:MAG TPA: 3-hydroxyacyl-CoA dehydrogenase NAD-binding domain-containing protein, partial [Burkholderiales bacterium]|nr:3-hydroxyacyl-CoA dehydrogenase NAD-binding domain-containing protein [Burkholderiales bacterium]
NTPVSTASPNLRELIAAIEASPKPVVAAIHGVAMGGGLELSLGCHYRVASPGAQLALPEVKLGLIPGAGGTQRLPRALGAERALEMIVTGNPVTPESVVGTLLIDAVIEGDLLQGALAFSEKIVGDARPLRILRELPAELAGPENFFAEARARVAREYRGFPAPVKCVDAVEAAVKLPSFEEGVKFERRCFEELIVGTESKALRHAFFGERAVAKIPGVPEDTRTIEIRSAAVVGAGTMGGGIAMVFANAGVPVKLLEMKREALDKGLATIRKNYASAVARGRLAQAEMDKRLARISPTLAYEDLGDSDLAIEAVFEDMQVKKEVFARLDRAMKKGAVLATNTSTLDVDAIGASISRPEAVIGMHFFSPANVMRLLEVVRGAKTSNEVLATVMKLAKTLGKIGVVSGVCDGFIGNRMVERYLQQAFFMLDEGASPEGVDKALQDWGMAMGPFAMSDLAGNDIGWHIRRRRTLEHPEFAYSKIPDLICELGRFGQKTGAGFYKYESDSRTPVPDPVVEKLIENYRGKAGLRPRTLKDEEIVERCIFALANEGARILEEGIALRAVDIDMVYLTGYGFPRYRGGPMFYADAVGLKNAVAAMQKYGKGYHGECWQATPLLAKLAAEGKTFN